ncbi:N,N-dimethylformamidase beta subunit family domain-containing protein [Dactylosporangium sp. NPDC050588]|uniref:N,N-dimethylformamidase beta subunit family domain-containing protein n=1 Tax=Dactylosporangium sp. NPDC050588 TaxID=3157211 RepID=UPI0033D16AA1
MTVADGAAVTVSAYARATSVVAGAALTFVTTGAATVVVTDAVTGLVMCRDTVDGPTWTLRVPVSWPSSLYRATFAAPGALPRINAAGDDEAWFVVRSSSSPSSSSSSSSSSSAASKAPILVSVPFSTWQAYNRAGVPGEGLYYAEEPTRAAAVSFDRPGGGPPPERWEEPLLRWLRVARYEVDYCSNLDLHLDPAILDGHRTLVVCAHDEYWTWEQRDAVEAFVRRGGNLAVFGANTAWWQMRLEDGGRTMVCHRDATTDPMSTVDPGRVTVEWSSAPVNRPENAMTGVSFRRGAGAWGDGMAVIGREAFTARFADHWVFDGTGLSDGDKFGQGTLGYETDAADIADVGGVPRATGRDGTPPSFVVLATADLRHWRRYGQGGAATMGVFDLGAGTVFTAATVNWGKGLTDPVVDRITRNVLDRFTATSPAGWTVIGPPAELHALTACGGVLYAVNADGALLAREACGQNLPWHRIGDAPDVLCLASPREAAGGMRQGLWALTTTGRLIYRDPAFDATTWTDVADAPPGARGLALCDAGLFAAARGDTLWHLPALELETGAWRQIGTAGGSVALTTLGGRLYAITGADRIAARPPVPRPHAFTDMCDAGAARTLTAHAGRLLTAGPGTPLRHRLPVMLTSTQSR